MYGGRMGNDDDGDGYLYRARGFIMLTGHDNYRTRGDAVGLDLVRDPELAAERDHASRSAGYYWQARVSEVDRCNGSASAPTTHCGVTIVCLRFQLLNSCHTRYTPPFMAHLPRL